MIHNTPSPWQTLPLCELHAAARLVVVACCHLDKLEAMYIPREEGEDEIFIYDMESYQYPVDNGLFSACSQLTARSSIAIEEESSPRLMKFDARVVRISPASPTFTILCPSSNASSTGSRA